jgi:ubiquinone/menaquinone biosynthesis C-methylase UbiE
MNTHSSLGERVVDVGCGAGIDSLIAARKVGPFGEVVGVDMTPAMVEKAQAGAAEAGLLNTQFHVGFAESLPVEDGWADVVISNGVLNLFPDKLAALQEMARALRPGGRLQIGDILVDRAVGEKGKRNSIFGKAELPELCWRRSSRRRSSPQDSWDSRSRAEWMSMRTLRRRRAPRRSEPWASTSARLGPGPLTSGRAN